MSLFITFEGTEGCGKSTQIDLLAKHLGSKNKNYLLTREPGATPIGKQIRSLLLNRENTNIVPLTELLLYAADRAQHCEEIIRPALKENKTVICDRFFDSTTAYQEGGRQLPSKLVSEINQLATQGLKPHITFLLDLPVEIGLKRALKRASIENDTQDRFEREKLDFHERVRIKYHEIASQEAERVILVDANQDIQNIHQKIIQILESALT